VRKEAGSFYVIRKDRPCFFARGFPGHNVPIISKRNRLVSGGKLDFGPWERIFYGPGAKARSVGRSANV
jgi:hypothetical protein